jgi:probable blue pigment (indigoidine) exporter
MLVLLVSIWGLNYLFVGLGLTGSGPLWLATLRAGVGLAGMLVLVRVAHRRGTFGWGARRDALLLGIPNTTLFFGLWFIAARSVPPGIASVVVYTFPLWVALLSGPMLGRQLSRGAWGSVAVGFVGVALIAQVGSLGRSGVSWLPIIELAAAALSWAVGTVLFQRRFSTAEILPASAYQLAGGFSALLGATLVLTPLPLPAPSFDVIAAALWLGLAGTAVGYSIWFTLLNRTPAAEISAYLFLVPVVALGASALLLGERLTWVQGLGVAFVLLAIYGVGRASAPRIGSRDPGSGGLWNGGTPRKTVDQRVGGS